MGMDFSTILIKAIGFVGSAIFLVIAFLQKRKAKKAAETWQTAQGTILTSGIQEKRSRSSKGYTTTTYWPYVTYQYSIMGQVYQGDKLGFGSAGYTRAKAEEVLAPYPQGAPVTVHYDPDDPNKAVLEMREFGAGGLIAAGIIFLVLGVISLFVVK